MVRIFHMLRIIRMFKAFCMLRDCILFTGRLSRQVRVLCIRNGFRFYHFGLFLRFRQVICTEDFFRHVIKVSIFIQDNSLKMGKRLVNQVTQRGFRNKRHPVMTRHFYQLKSTQSFYLDVLFLLKGFFNQGYKCLNKCFRIRLFHLMTTCQLFSQSL